MGLFAIKEKTRARMRTVVAAVVSPHVHRTRTCTHACDTRTLARAAAAVEISRGEDAKSGLCIGAHTPSFLSPRWFNEPIRRSFLSAVLPTFFPQPHPGRTLGLFPASVSSTLGRHHHRVVSAPFCRVSSPHLSRLVCSFFRSRVRPIPVISFLNFLVPIHTTRLRSYFQFRAGTRSSACARPIAVPIERNIEIGFTPRRTLLKSAL